MPPPQFQVQQGRKRPRQSEQADTDQVAYPRGQKTRAYTGSQRLILEQAAAILNVSLNDLTGGNDTTPLSPELSVPCSLHDLSSERGVCCASSSAEADQLHPNHTVNPVVARTTPDAVYHSGELDSSNPSRPVAVSSSRESIWDLGPAKPQPTNIWAGTNGPKGSSGSRVPPRNANEYIYQSSSYTGVDESCLSLTAGFTPNADSALGDESTSPLDLFAGQSIPAESGLVNMEMGALGPQILGAFPPSLDSAYGSMADLWNYDPCTMKRPTGYWSAGSTMIDPSLGHLLPLLNPAAVDHQTQQNYQVSTDGGLGFYNPLSSTSQVPTQVTPVPSYEPWPGQLQLVAANIEDFEPQTLNRELPFYQPLYNIGMETINVQSDHLQSTSNDVTLDLLQNGTRDSVNERHLVLRGPSPVTYSSSFGGAPSTLSGPPFPLSVMSPEEVIVSVPKPKSSGASAIVAMSEVVSFTSGAAPNPDLSKPVQGPRVRQPFKDHKKRMETGETRKVGACVRCRMQRIRCSPADNNEDGPCATCARISGATLCKLPCVRYKITDSSLFDKGQHPQFRWSQRWSSWDLVEVDTWASPEIKTITVTQDVFGGATFKIRCREFIPVEGDALSRTWKKNGETVHYHRAPYAILNMKETGNEVKKFVANNIGTSISYYILQKKDPLLSKTYAMAYAMIFRSNNFANNEETKRLLQEVFQLWVAIRMESQSERIVGDETLGMEPQLFDADVSSYGTNSIPPIMSAQVELMTTTRILQPLKKAVLQRLQRLIKANELRYWFSIYLCLFILLHSCSVLTADEHKQARKHGLKTRYLYQSFVEELHTGSKTMIYYFHYCNKGSYPFSPEWMTDENLTLAQLNSEQAAFLKESAAMIEKRLPEFKAVRENGDFESDWYFVSQLYDQNWRPSFTV